MKRALAAVSVLLVAACGRAVPPARQASTAASGQHPSPTPSAHSATATFDLLPPSGTVPAIDLQISCNRPIGASDSVAIVQLHDGSTVLRDYADAGHPYTACSFGTNRSVTQLIDAHHVVVPSQGCSLFAVVDLPDVRPRWFQLPRQSECPSLLAVAPGLDAVAWMSPDLTANSDQVHLTTHAGDRVVASLQNPHGGRCGSADDSKSGSYTQSGSHLFVLDQPLKRLELDPSRRFAEIPSRCLLVLPDNLA